MSVFNYFLFRAWIPLVALAVYVALRDVPDTRFRKLYQYAYVTLAALLAAVLVINLRGGELYTFFSGGAPRYGASILGANVTLEGSVVSLVFGAAVLWFIHRATGRHFYPIVAAVLSMFTIGWLYEIPFLHGVEMFINPHPFSWDILYYPSIIHPQLASLLYLLATLGAEGYKVTKLLWVAVLIYSLYAGIMFFNADSVGVGWSPLLDRLWLSKWVIRLPSALLILSLFTGHSASTQNRECRPLHSELASKSDVK